MELEVWVKIALAFLCVGFMWLADKLKHEDVSCVFVLAGIFWGLAYITFFASTR